MLISHSYRCLFIHIPKCAGSSLKNSLNLDLVVPPHWHCPWEKAQAVLGSEITESYFKFTFIRNPWERIISAWQMFEQQPWCFHRSYSLLEFLEVVVNSSINPEATYQTPAEMAIWEHSPANIRHHTLPCVHPYYGLVDNQGQLTVDFVGRLETLDRDIQIIAKQLNLPNFTLPKSNPTDHDHYRYYYDPKSIEIVRDYYQQDLDRFGYQF
jgi:hypothetical protein